MNSSRVSASETMYPSTINLFFRLPPPSSSAEPVARALPPIQDPYELRQPHQTLKEALPTLEISSQSAWVTKEALNHVQASGCRYLAEQKAERLSGSRTAASTLWKTNYERRKASAIDAMDTHATHRRKLSVLRNVHPCLAFSRSVSSFSSDWASRVAISCIASLLIYPHGFRDLLTPVLYATHKIWPEESAYRRADRSAGADGSREVRVAGRSA